MNIFKIITSSLLFLCLIACSGQSPTRGLETDSSVDEMPKQIAEIETPVILIISENGGCMMMGPNCSRYALMSDGIFEVFRVQGTEVANSGTLDMQLVDEWMQVAAETDFESLLARLGEGECRACYDGVDLSYTVLPASKDITINSSEYEFSGTEDFFAISEILHKAMRKAAPLELQSR